MYLFAFATPAEFVSLFPEHANFANENTSDKLIKLSGNRGYACILGLGILNFATNLTYLLSSVKQQKIEISAVIILGVCGAYPGRGLDVGDVVRVDSERVGDFGVVERDGSFTPWHKVCSTSANGSVAQASAQVYESSSLRGVPAWLSKLKPVSGLSVNCCTGTASMAADRVRNFNVDVESMEGAACFSICHAFCVPCCEIRAVSNFATTEKYFVSRMFFLCYFCK